MKTTSIIAAAILSITGTAFAQGEATYQYPQAVSSAKSRADVVAELQQARAAGQIVSGEANVVPRTTTVSQKSRAEVRAMAAEQSLPLNVEAISFDGRTMAQGASQAGAQILASNSR
ncbi:MAG TPA: DUF4148 domain-containing protein [Rubrivivax sp.]|nr:DUF4148 domain-containing protein [Rubrivivax sp.]